MTNVNKEVINGWSVVDDDNNEAGFNEERKLDYLKLPEGDTRIRVLDVAPYAFKEWWAPRGNGGKGTSIPYKGKDDLLEAENKAFMEKVFQEADRLGLKGDKRKKFLREKGYSKLPWGKVKQKYVIHVLDRATGEVKLLEKGNGLFKELKKYAVNPEYGDLRQYDVTITRKGSGLNTEYTVTPARQNTPLTDEEIRLYEESKVDLAKLKDHSHITPEQCLAVAKGAKWEDVLKKNNNDEEKVDQDTSPQDDYSEGSSEEPIEIDSGEVLTDEELENLEF
ncbi:phosphoesterase [Geobacillus phage GBK1]|nr:phosphoesterase [Geobacillus phage GBK1]